MIAGIIIGGCCYALVWLFTARLLYGRWRAKGIDEEAEWAQRNLIYTRPPLAETVSNWDRINRWPVMLGALSLGLIWPLALMAVPVIRFMDSAPQMSQAEMRGRIAERDRRIAELEREAGIKPG